jgi:CIC family chloride channel protein
MLICPATSMTAIERIGALLRRLQGRALRAELRLAPTESQRLLLLTLLIGAAGGLAAVAFHFAIELGERLLIDRALAAPGRSWIAWSILSPTLGGLLAGVLLHLVFPDARGSGIPQVKVAYASRAGLVRLRDAVGKFLLGSLQIGSGASLGREGPTVQICAGVATALGRLGQVAPQSLRRLIPVGAAAGIAAAFNAPIAAVTFTIEEIVGTLDQTVLSGVIVAAALAAVIERNVLGAQPIFDIPQRQGMDDARSLLLYAALGLAAALVAVLFTDGLLLVRRGFRRLRLVPRWAQPALGGLATGLLIVGVMLWLGVGGVNGGGYGLLRQALGGSVPLKVMLALGAAKLAATVFSYSSGGAGGIFAPALFIGAMLGGSFGVLDRALFDHPPETIGAFALVGMGAVFSGAIRAPITSVLIIVEMTAGYRLILPLMIANMSAYVLARRWRPAPIYEALLAQDGIHLRERSVLDTLEELRLDDHLRRSTDFVRFDAASPAAAILRGAVPGQAVFPVLGGDGRLLGLLGSREVTLLEGHPDAHALLNAADLMRPAIAVRFDGDLRSAYELMRAEDLPELPVCDAEGRVIGFVDEVSMAKAFLRASGPEPRRGA